MNLASGESVWIPRDMGRVICVLSEKEAPPKGQADLVRHAVRLLDQLVAEATPDEVEELEREVSRLLPLSSLGKCLQQDKADLLMELLLMEAPPDSGAARWAEQVLELAPMLREGESPELVPAEEARLRAEGLDLAGLVGDLL